jgi:hypothetical protein
MLRPSSLELYEACILVDEARPDLLAARSLLEYCRQTAFRIGDQAALESFDESLGDISSHRWPWLEARRRFRDATLMWNQGHIRDALQDARAATATRDAKLLIETLEAEAVLERYND